MTEHIAAGPEWEDLFDLLVSKKGVALITGETDSGKSTLARYLTGRLLTVGITVALVDSDIGQSSLGLPGTISMKVFRKPEDLGRFRFQRMCFIGTTNPAKKISSVVAETKRMVGHCRRASGIVIVDTTGLVTGGVGRALKVRKIQAVAPDHVIALQRKNELEHILGLLSDIRVHRLAVSDKARKRSWAERVRYRQEKFDQYFRRPLSAFLLRADKVNFLLDDKTFLFDKDVPSGSLVGLNHGRNTLAIGAVTRAYRRAVAIVAPVESVRKVDRVVFGEIVYVLNYSLS